MYPPIKAPRIVLGSITWEHACIQTLHCCFFGSPNASLRGLVFQTWHNADIQSEDYHHILRVMQHITSHQASADLLIIHRNCCIEDDGTFYFACLNISYQDKVPINQRSIQEGMSARCIKHKVWQGAPNDCDIAQCNSNFGIKSCNHG